jgi:hypothetical protein
MITVSMSEWTIAISILSVVAGYVSNAVQTGSFLGIKTVPQAWLPYLTLAGTFLTGFLQSGVGAAPPITGTTILQAVLAGLTALTGATVGVTVHQHLATVPTPPANDNATPNQRAA